MGIPSAGGQQAAPQQQPPDIFATIRRLQDLERRKLAKVGVEAYQESQAPQAPIPPPVEEPEETSWWRTITDPLLGALSKWQEFREAETGLTSAIPRVKGIPIPGLGLPGTQLLSPTYGGPEEQDRQERIRAVQRQLATGQISLTEAGRQAGEIHRERGGFHKFMLESTSPVGALEAAIPFKTGWVAKPVSLAVRPVTRPVVRGISDVAKRMPLPGLKRSQIAQEIRPGYSRESAELLAARALAPETGTRVVPQQPAWEQVVQGQMDNQNPMFKDLAQKLQQVPFIGNLALSPIKWFNPNAIRDLSNPIERYIVSDAIGKEVARDNAKIMMNKVLAKGDPKALFGLGDDFSTNAIQLRTKFRKAGLPYDPALDPAERNIFFNEIAQHPNKYVLNTAQREWLDNFRTAVDDMNDYLKDKGVLADDWLTHHKVPGDYFPNVWKMLGDMQIEQVGGEASKLKPFYEQTRYYGLAQEAIDAGFRPGDPMEAVELLFRSMYNQVHESEMARILKPLGNTYDERLSIARRQAQQDALRQKDDSALALQVINLFRRTGHIGPGASFKGSKATAKAQPEIMAEFARITGLKDPGDLKGLNKGQLRQLLIDRKRELAALEKKAAVAAKNARTHYEVVNAKYQGARKAAGAREYIDEIEMKFKSGNVVISSKDAAEQIYPERMINDIKSISNEDYRKLKNYTERTGNSFKLLTDVSAAMRTLQAGTDMGVIFIHGLPTLFRNPQVWGRSVKHSLAAFKDPVASAKLQENHWETVKKLAQYNQLHGGGSEYIEGLRDSGLLMRSANWAAQKRPHKIVKPVTMAGRGARAYFKGVERQFDGWIMAAKIHLWEAMEPAARQAFEAGDLNAMNELASHIAKMTGTLSTANMGISPTVRNVMGTFLMFAPRYRMATYGIMADLARGGVRGDQARKTVGSLMAGGVLSYALIATRLGQPVHLDPRDGKFMTIKVGDGRIGIGSAFVSLARFAGNIAETAQENPEKFVSLNTSDNPVVRFARGQLSPLSGSAWDITSGRNFIGQPTNFGAPMFKHVVAQGLLPFWASSYTEYPRPGIGVGPAEFGGFRGFPVNIGDKAVQLADIAASNTYEKLWGDLDGNQRKDLLDANPEIQKLFDESNELWLKRSTGLPLKINEYRADQKRIKADYRNDMDTLLEKLHMGGLDARDFRNAVQDLNAIRSSAYTALAQQNPEAIEALEDYGSDPDAHAEDIAFEDYVNTIIQGEFENDEGEFDFDAQEMAVTTWKRKWGDANYNYVQEYLEHDLSDLEKELRQGRQQYKAYWGVGKRILEKIGQENLTTQWNEYMGARKIVREKMEIEYPIFKKVRRAQKLARQQMRDLDPKLDEWLYRWQYTDTLRDGTPNKTELYSSLLKY